MRWELNLCSFDKWDYRKRRTESMEIFYFWMHVPSNKTGKQTIMQKVKNKNDSENKKPDHRNSGGLGYAYKRFKEHIHFLNKMTMDFLTRDHYTKYQMV